MPITRVHHKPTVAKRPFSRITDGERHVVTVRRIAR